MISNDQAQQFIRALLRQPPKVVAQTKQEDPLGIFEQAPRATYGRQLSTSKNVAGRTDNTEAELHRQRTGIISTGGGDNPEVGGDSGAV